MNPISQDPCPARRRSARLLQPLLLLVIRLYWGWQFFIDGKGKLQNLDKVDRLFREPEHPDAPS